MGEHIIELSDLTKKYGSFTAVDHLNLKINKGEIFGLLGPNGAGKTTTIKLIMGHLQRDGGNIEVYGKELEGNEKFYKDIIGYIADECYFPPAFTVNDVRETIRSFYPSFDPDRFNQYIKKWEPTV